MPQKPWDDFDGKQEMLLYNAILGLVRASLTSTGPAMGTTHMLNTHHAHSVAGAGGNGATGRNDREARVAIASELYNMHRKCNAPLPLQRILLDCLSAIVQIRFRDPASIACLTIAC